MTETAYERPCGPKRFIGNDTVVDPFTVFSDWRSRGPVQEVNLMEVFGIPDRTYPHKRVFTVLGYEACQTILNSPERMGSSFKKDIAGTSLGRTLLELDPPVHTAERALVALAFRPSALERWNEDVIRPMVRALADDLRKKDSAELVEEFTIHFPTRAIASILGMKDDFLPNFERWVLDIFNYNDAPEAAQIASQELEAYCRATIDEKRTSPSDDLVTSLTRAEIDGERLTDDQIVGFMKLLFPAGGETTFRALGNLIWSLLKHPDQLAAVQADRSLLPSAVEESLRWQPVVACYSPRIANIDFEAYGIEIPRGSTLYFAFGAANRDPSRWENPDRFDVFRRHLPHIAFAGGPHLCLGMHLARLEVREAMDALLDAVDDLRFDAGQPEPHLHGARLRCPCSLPVTYTPK